MKRKILLTVAVILMVMLSACGMSEEKIGTALSNINNEYQSGTYEQAQTEIVKLEKVTKKMTDEQKSKYDELKPLIEYATQKSGEINNALNDAQSLCDQKMYYASFLISTSCFTTLTELSSDTSFALSPCVVAVFL